METKYQNLKKHFLSLPMRLVDAKLWELTTVGVGKSEKPVAIHLYGEAADAGELDDRGFETFGIIGGEHHGHVLTFETSKHNCGAWYEDTLCSCGQSHENSVSGCWQYGHQRTESGKSFDINFVY